MKAKSIILTVSTGLFGLMMVNSGLNKFFMYMPMGEMSEGATQLFTAFGESGWIFPLIATVEIVAGVLIAIPKTRALGAIMILPITIGILLFHLNQDPAGIAIGIILLAINGWTILDNKDKYMGMIQ